MRRAGPSPFRRQVADREAFDHLAEWGHFSHLFLLLKGRKKLAAVSAADEADRIYPYRGNFKRRLPNRRA
jgi:hypothetical protein